MRKSITATTDADNLRELRNRLMVRGYESEILDLRLQFNEQAAILGYVKAVLGKERVHPHFLPTQASGRWSVTDPPMTNWTPDIRDMVVPDPGTAWVGFDLDAIEGKIVAAFSHDKQDLLLFSPIWCTKCGHAHNNKEATSILVGGFARGRGLVLPTKAVEEQDLRYVNQLTNGRLGRGATSRRDNEGARLLHNPQDYQEKTSTFTSCTRSESYTVEQKAYATIEQTTPSTNQVSIEQTTQTEQILFGSLACSTCGCTSTKKGPADIHTITACRMTGIELPPNIVDPHQSPEAAEWREKLKWKGKDDIRRVTAKVRYCLLYGKDWTAVNGSKYEKDMVKLGFRREVLQDAAKAFLRSKPNLLACKRKYWEESAKTSESRTIFGRRRRLFGDWWSKAKEGWNHKVQGSVTDMVNLSLIELCKGNRTLVYPSHDAAKVSLPAFELVENREGVLNEFKHAVEREWIIDSEKIVSSATWHIYHADGSVDHL